jgi:ubiquinone/menaquinone biosynthesis C-methylase UbiE
MNKNEASVTTEASQFVGDIPETYDRCLGPIIFEDYARDLARRAAAMRPARVLELAAGTGVASRKLRDVLPKETHLTVTDLNAPMLEVARAKFNSDENVAFVTADAMQLDFPDNEFDLIVCQFGVMFFPDKVAAFREAHRVLRSGGAYIFNTWRPLTENPFANIADDATAQFFPDDPPQFYKAPFSYPEPETVCADVSAAGFVKIEHDAVNLTKPVTDWRHFAHGLVYGNPLIDEIRRRGGVDADEVMRAIEAELRARHGAEPTSMPLRATVFQGRAA